MRGLECGIRQVQIPTPFLCYVQLWGIQLDTIKTYAMIFIGPIIKAELDRQERSVSWFARKIGCDRSTVYRIFQRASIDTQLLMRISTVLDHDFFADISQNIHHVPYSDSR